MHIKLFTLPFESTIEGFDNELITKFCLNKKIHQIKTNILRIDGKYYNNISIIYDEVLQKEDKLLPQLSEAQLLLMTRLKEWRKSKAEKLGLPAFMIFNNAHLFQIVTAKYISLERLKQIKGFGKARVEKYGKDIVTLVKEFYREQNTENQLPDNSKTSEKLKDEEQLLGSSKTSEKLKKIDNGEQTK